MLRCSGGESPASGEKQVHEAVSPETRFNAIAIAGPRVAEQLIGFATGWMLRALVLPRTRRGQARGC